MTKGFFNESFCLFLGVKIYIPLHTESFPIKVINFIVILS